MVLNVSHYQVKSYSCAVPDATFFVNDLMKYNTVHIHTKIFCYSYLSTDKCEHRLGFGQPQQKTASLHTGRDRHLQMPLSF